jgi:hypothetical protein
MTTANANKSDPSNPILPLRGSGIPDINNLLPDLSKIAPDCDVKDQFAIGGPKSFKWYGLRVMSGKCQIADGPVIFTPFLNIFLFTTILFSIIIIFLGLKLKK